MDERERALVEAIENHGDDHAYLVYADLLAERGDPRAELIVLQADPKRAVEAGRYLERECDAILGPLAKFAVARELHLSWHLGFVREARIMPTGPRRARAVVTALFATPNSRFLRRLDVYDAELDQPALEALVAELGRPRTLETITLLPIVFFEERIALPDIDLGAAERDHADLNAEIERLLEDT
jgi:uncharacterized protein (TIGR02996 family)